MLRTRLGALVAGAAVLFAACGGAASPSPAASQSAAASASESASASASASQSAAPKSGGTIVVAIPGDMKRTDPAMVDDSNSSYVAQNVMEGLVGLEPGSTSKLKPVLAESLPEVSADGTTYTFTIRSGVKFHDGTTLDANAVKVNYDRWTSFPKALQTYTYYANTVLGQGAEGNVASTSVDGNKFVIKLKAPNSSFLLSQTLPQFGIASPTALKAGKADNSVTNVSKIPYAQGGNPTMVGTGPFKWDHWTKGSEAVIVKNPDYWDKDHAALLDKVVFKPIADETAILNGLQAGDIDIAQKVSPVDIENIKSNSQLQVIDRGESCNLFHLGINENYAKHTPAPVSKASPLAKVEARQAVMYAINRDELINTFYAGQAKAADNWMPLNVQYAKPLNLPKYDPEKAKQLIQQSGLSGNDLTIDFWYPSDVTRPYLPDPKGIFEALTSDLEAVGFKIRPHTSKWDPTYLDEEYAGKYEMWEIGWTCDWAGPDNFLKTAFFGYQNGKPSPEFDYKNDALEKAMNDALAATDEATAKQLWEQAQDLLAKDLPTIPIVNSSPPGVAQASIKGFVGAGNLTELLNAVWTTK